MNTTETKRAMYKVNQTESLSSGKKMQDWQICQKKRKDLSVIKYVITWGIKMEVIIDYNEIQKTIKGGFENLH